MSLRVLIVAGDESARDRLRRLVEVKKEVVAGIADRRQIRHVLDRLRAEAPGRDVLVVADEAGSKVVGDAMAAGAWAYLGADEEPPSAPTADPLTTRQRDVLRLLALGHTNQEVAQTLSLSVRTVETHRAHVMRKLRASSRADLVRYAIETGLIG